MAIEEYIILQAFYLFHTIGRRLNSVRNDCNAPFSHCTGEIFGTLRSAPLVLTISLVAKQRAYYNCCINYDYKTAIVISLVIFLSLICHHMLQFYCIYIFIVNYCMLVSKAAGIQINKINKSRKNFEDLNPLKT
jgi:hypothetical protein